MRTDGELTKEEFLEQKNRLMDKLALTTNKVIDNNEAYKTWLELIEDFFNTIFQAKTILEHGTKEEKQIFLTKVGENFLLKDKQLAFTFKKPFDLVLNPLYRQSVLGCLDSNQE
ncbi:MAG: hypothetical protein KatS3mg087_1271 [Patescibacteria group bacterium]|nr:MAG: hypothetical protein KatS3mg087_1271 [Patescibacteria group bacterium]